MTSVRLENLTLSYDRRPALHHVSGVFAAGSLTAVAGPNGAGKSTLLKGIAGIMHPDEGRIVIEKCATSKTATEKNQSAGLAYLPQASELERDFPLSVLQMICTGFWNQTGGLRAIAASRRDAALAALGTVGLRGFEHRQIGTLSAGQFQRALFARLLLQDAPLILLDEPFTAIDAETTAKLLALVLRWHMEGRTVICVLHDLEQIRRYFPQCLLLARECVAWGPSAETLDAAHLQDTRFFHEAWHSETDRCALL